MSSLLDEQQSGFPFGTRVTLQPQPLRENSAPEAGMHLSLFSASCQPVELVFNRAGHNHFDQIFSYCFTLPSGDELWIGLSDSLNTAERVSCLKKIFSGIQ